MFKINFMSMSMSMSMSMIIFVQASRDIQYAIGLYEKYKRNYHIKIYVINQVSNYNIINDLCLSGCTVKFICDRPLRSLSTVFIERPRLFLFYCKEFKNLKKSKIYFFSHYFDSKTFYFVSKLSKKNTVTFLDHYKIERVKSKFFNFNSKLKLTLLWLNTGIWFDMTSQDNIITFDYRRYGITKTIVNGNFDNIDKYRKKMEVEKKSIILFDSNDGGTGFFSNYDLVLIDILDVFFNAGYSIYVKPHPRLGCSELFKDNRFKVISADIPQELMDLSNFTYSLGNVTAALAGCNTLSGCISCINILNFVESERKKEFEKYLLNLDPYIYMPKNLRELKLLILEGK